MTIDQPHHALRLALGLFVRAALLCCLLSGTGLAETTKHSIKMTFHRLTFDQNATPELGYLVVIHNVSTGERFRLAYDMERTYGFPDDDILECLGSWFKASKTSPSGRGYLEFMLQRVTHLPKSDLDIGDGPRPDNCFEAMRHPDIASDQAALIFFRDCLNHIQTMRSDATISGETSEFSLSLKDSYAYQGDLLPAALSDMSDAVRGKIKQYQQDSTGDESWIAGIPWPGIAGVGLIALSLIMFLTWPRNHRAKPTEDSEVVRSPHRTGGFFSGLADYLQNKQEQRSKRRQTGELLERTVKALNRQHALATHYYSVLSSVASQLGVVSKEERSLDPTVDENLRYVHKRLQKRGKYARLRKLLDLPSNPAVSSALEGKEAVASRDPHQPGAGPADQTGHQDYSHRPEDHSKSRISEGGTDDATGSESSQAEGNRLDAQSSLTRPPLKRELRRLTEHLWKIPDRPTSKFLTQLSRHLHSSIWLSRHLQAGVEDWRRALDDARFHPLRQEISSIELSKPVEHLVPSTSRNWDDRPDMKDIDYLGPELLARCLLKLDRLVTGQSELSKLQRASGLRDEFARLEWPLNAFRSIAVDDFSGVSREAWNVVQALLSRDNTILLFSELANDLMYADVDKYLGGLTLPDDVQDDIRGASRGALNGPRLSEVTSTMLAGLARFCLNYCSTRGRLGVVESRVVKRDLTGHLRLQWGSHNQTLVTPILRAPELLNLVEELGAVRHPRELSEFRRALHPVKRSAERARAGLEKLLDQAGLRPEQMEFYTPANPWYQVEEYEHQGRSMLLWDYFRRFGEEAFRNVYRARGLRDGDNNAVVNVKQWNLLTRDGSPVREFRPKVWTFKYNSIPIGLKRTAPEQADWDSLQVQADLKCNHWESLSAQRPGVNRPTLAAGETDTERRSVPTDGVNVDEPSPGKRASEADTEEPSTADRTGGIPDEMPATGYLGRQRYESVDDRQRQPREEMQQIQTDESKTSSDSKSGEKPSEPRRSTSPTESPSKEPDDRESDALDKTG